MACAKGQIIFIKRTARKRMIHHNYSENGIREQAKTHIFECKVAFLRFFKCLMQKYN